MTQDRWLGAALACERAAAALVQAMALSPRPIAACVTMMQMCAHFQEPYWLRQLFLGNAPETITHEDIDEPGMMDAALAHLVELGVPRLTPEQTPDALPPAWRRAPSTRWTRPRIIGRCARWTCGPGTWAR